METGRGLGEDHDCDRRTSSKAELVGSSLFVTIFLSVPLKALFYQSYPSTSGSSILE